MAYRDPWREACENAKQLLRLGLTPEEVVERTRLPKSVIDGIAPPILRENARQKAIEEAERAVEREYRKVLKEKYPCPMCGKGYGIADGGVTTAFLNGAVQPVDSTDVPESSPFFRPYWAHCSNRRCIARLMFPRDTEEDALDAFVLGEWVRPHPFRSLEDGTEWTWSQAGLRNEVIHLLADHTTEQVEQLGFNPPAVEKLANQLALRRMELNPEEAFDTTIPRTEVKSDGFVLHTLNAALWCLANTDNYQDCVLAAVNLGEDTDTTASVAGALAGDIYGFESIPQEWVRKLRGRELLDMYVSEATRKR